MSSLRRTATVAGSRIELGALFEIFVVIAVIGTAVTVFPIVKRQSEGL